MAKALNLTKLTAYGDTMNDGKMQLSFTLPVKNDDRGKEAAKALARKMGVADPSVTHSGALDENFTFYVVYGSVSHTVDYESLSVHTIGSDVMDMDGVDEYIRSRIRRKVVVAGASIGDDAHTVGIDAIMNMKGFAGHYGLERYQMVEAHNLGSQVPPYEFMRKLKELKADVALVSQTVTQKDIHIKTLTELVELLEAEGMRDKLILCCGGPRVSHELAKELGYDAGFGPGKFAEDVASFFVTDMVKRGLV
ncbi:MAG: cobalamin-dependent protein [Defluviitaleaceae bacterium]|nr:cobalamin-dependent protein [Defluviitaleaceae bacterium]MCL2836276.1 cobalamin-dependent protein [Defluviitaleaceae bacterium]